jgi:purine-binding chemotaxis protein CheW
VDEPPNLVELPLDILRRLPKSQIQGNGVLEMVSHAAVLSQENVTTTIFLLDVKQVLNTGSRQMAT